MTEKLSLSGKRWTLKRNTSTPDIAGMLRMERGIIDEAQAKLSDPFLFREMQRAVKRIEQAMKSGETVAIFGDYDADGITATAQLVRFFRRRKIEPVVHLPDRAKEGYGMKIISIDALKAKGVSLIITVDTGIAAHTEIAHANSLGIDVIITDHHRVQGKTPHAYAIIHPDVPSAFPNPHLSGSGVAFMLVRALEKEPSWDGIDIDIALAAIGTVGDLVPLTGENRLLVIHGLKFLQTLPPSPLKDFVDSVRSTGPLTATDIAYRIVPRINAAGRMAHPLVALEALLEGGEALEELHRLNGDRRSFVEELQEEIIPSITADDAFIVIASERITPGTAGLVAGRLSEKFGRPSIAAAIMGDMAVASVRSIPEIDLMECLEHPSVKKFLKTFGGHAQAAGCTFMASDTDALRLALNAVLLERGISSATLVPTLELDAALDHRHLTMAFARSLTSLAPFGTGNTEPMFLLSQQRLTDLRTVGADNSHLQAKVNGISAVGFRLGPCLTQLNSETSVDLVCRIGINSWNGRESVQLVIEDIRKSG
ncbi:MAG: single-stranded-DNA-specific exonuclease RecJ [Candidatus Peribacteraceae bacterium]|nr:single-stranded-DNA-specific exonuclease RecJ [Candidatus Peribacteraceae bacterium]